jgi:hypothetical protein
LLDVELGHGTALAQIIGAKFVDPLEAQRVWQVDGVYMPIHGRAIGGFRTKVRDQKDFVSFCNQRDLEVLLGVALPGEFCPWLDEDYVRHTDDGWVGLVCDDEDLRDDLYEREWFLRGYRNEPFGILSNWNEELQRRVHLGRHNDVEDLFVLLGDIAPDTGVSPDTRQETIEHRWMRSERRRVRWEKV